MAAFQKSIVTYDFTWFIFSVKKETVHLKSTRRLQPRMCGLAGFLIKPGGFPWLAGAVLEVLIDSTAGCLGGDFTDNWLPCLKPKIWTGRFKCRGFNLLFSTKSQATCFRIRMYGLCWSRMATLACVCEFTSVWSDISQQYINKLPSKLSLLWLCSFFSLVTLTVLGPRKAHKTYCLATNSTPLMSRKWDYFQLESLIFLQELLERNK